MFILLFFFKKIITRLISDFGLQLDTLIGVTMTMSVSGVTDLAGNIAPSITSWSFVMQNYGAQNASVSINGLQLVVAFNASFNLPNSTIMLSLVDSFSTYLQVRDEFSCINNDI